MDEGRHLESLIGELRKSTSKLEQLKILTRAWRVLRTLDSSQRMEVAAHLGIEEGLPLLDSLVSPGGLSTATLARAVAQAESANPKALKEILRGLKAPGHRMEAVRKGIALVEATLEEVDPSGPSVPDATPKQIPPPPVAETMRERPAPPPIPLAPKEPKLTTPAAEAPPRPKPVRPAPRPAAAPAERPVPDPTPSSGLERRWERLIAPSQPAAAAAPAAVAVSERSLTARFRDLRRALETGGLPPESLEILLSGFPEGWPRRRALATAIRSGAVDDVSALLDQIERLRPQDEFWCLSALLHSRNLSRPQMKEALSRSRGPRSRRLLERMLH